MTKQLQKLGQDIVMAILKISMCSKNMHILPLSSLISPVTKMSMSNQDRKSNLKKKKQVKLYTSCREPFPLTW